MKKNYKFTFQIAIVVVCSFLSLALTAQVKLPPKIQAVVNQNQLPGPVQVPANLTQKNIDLAVVDITFSIVNVKTRTVKIQGIVKNVGKQNFVSTAGQQVVMLYEEIPSLRPKAVASQAFQTVLVNNVVYVNFIRTWAPGEEFPPTYTVAIVYAPDVYSDSLTSNDDSNGSNNQFSKSGADINKLNWKK